MTTFSKFNFKTQYILHCIKLQKNYLKKFVNRFWKKRTLVGFLLEFLASISLRRPIDTLSWHEDLRQVKIKLPINDINFHDELDLWLRILSYRI